MGQTRLFQFSHDAFIFHSLRDEQHHSLWRTCRSGPTVRSAFQTASALCDTHLTVLRSHVRWVGAIEETLHEARQVYTISLIWPFATDLIIHIKWWLGLHRSRRISANTTNSYQPISLKDDCNLWRRVRGQISVADSQFNSCAAEEELWTFKNSWVDWAHLAVEEGEKRSYDVRLPFWFISTASHHDIKLHSRFMM